jgi:hypothetical protein
MRGSLDRLGDQPVAKQRALDSVLVVVAVGHTRDATRGP